MACREDSRLRGPPQHPCLTSACGWVSPVGTVGARHSGSRPRRHRTASKRRTGIRTVAHLRPCTGPVTQAQVTKASAPTPARWTPGASRPPRPGARPCGRPPAASRLYPQQPHGRSSASSSSERQPGQEEAAQRRAVAGLRRPGDPQGDTPAARPGNNPKIPSPGSHTGRCIQGKGRRLAACPPPGPPSKASGSRGPRGPQQGHLSPSKSLPVVFPSPKQGGHPEIPGLVEGLTLLKTLHGARPWLPARTVHRETTSQARRGHKLRSILQRVFLFLTPAPLQVGPQELRRVLRMHRIR